MDLHEEIECIRIALSDRASQLGLVNGDEVVFEMQCEVPLDVCVSRDEPNLERALKTAFERYKQRLSVESVFELSREDGESVNRILLKPAISLAPVVPKSARERCDSLARSAESSGGAQRVETPAAPIRAVLISRVSREAETETQKRDSNANTQRSGKGNRKSKQADDTKATAQSPAQREPEEPASIDTLLDILHVTQSKSARGKAKSNSNGTRTVIGCSLLLEMYKRGAVGLSFKLKSGAHEHSQMRVRLCVALPVRFVEQPTLSNTSRSAAADESVYGVYPFDRSATSPSDAEKPTDEDESMERTGDDEPAVRHDLSVTELYEALRAATLSQFQLTQQFATRFSRHTGVSDSDDVPLFELSEPAVFVFRLPQSESSYVNVVYPADVTRDNDPQFRSLRSDLHSALGVSTDRPVFRRAQAAFPSRRDAPAVGDDGLVSIPVGNSNKNSNNAARRTCPLLTNMHCAVLASEQAQGKADTQPRAGLKRAFVRGDYAYFHYVCDGFEDSQWGCAYRSLQTLVSWYVLNGWTRIGVPTIGEIQRALVACGDQEASLVGSSRWIGSTEVGLALQTLLASDGVEMTYKIQFVARGGELSSYVRLLLAHFDAIGTPVMIGGGQYAHTIIGAEFDEMQGRTRFLILDPHYVGPETVPTILKKGWCAWRDPATFFNDTTFYNLCLPQLPSAL